MFSGRAHVGYSKACADKVTLGVLSGAGQQLLLLELLLEVIEALAHGIALGASVVPKRVLLAVTVGARQVLVLLLEDLVHVDLLHRLARHAERVGEGSHFGAQGQDGLWAVDSPLVALRLALILVTKPALASAEPVSARLLEGKAVLGLVAKGVRRLLGSGEPVGLRKGELLLRHRVVHYRTLA